MLAELLVGVAIPARDEQGSISSVVRDLRTLRDREGNTLVDDIVVCDNASVDGTVRCALEAGARVVHEPVPGYGRACLTALAALDKVDVILFVDGDAAFDVSQSTRLLDAIAGGADLAIGARPLGSMEAGALSPPQRVGNKVAGLLISWLWKQRVTDLGPFRAIRATALKALDMQDQAYGWTVEMQIKAIQMKMRVVEVPVDTRRRRHGTSKVGGTIRGVVGASIGIAGMILKLWLLRRRTLNLRD